MQDAKLEERLVKRLDTYRNALNAARFYSNNSDICHQFGHKVCTLETALSNRNFSIVSDFPPDDKDIGNDLNNFFVQDKQRKMERLTARLNACREGLFNISHFSNINNRPALYLNLEKEFNTIKKAIDNNNFSFAYELPANDYDIHENVATYIQKTKKREARLTNRLKACMQAFNTIESRSDKNNRPRVYYDLKHEIYKLYNCKINKNFPPVIDFPPDDSDIQNIVDNYERIASHNKSLNQNHNNFASRNSNQAIASTSQQRPSNASYNRLGESSNRRAITPDRNAPSTSQPLTRNHHRHQ